MSDELRAAAERFAKQRPSEAYPWPCEMSEQPAQRVADMALLARAYLAEHPADDGEPIDEAFLRAVGFVGGLADVVLHFPDSDGKRLNQFLYGIHGGWTYTDAEENSAKIQTPATRGDLRRLLAALGLKK